MGCRLLESERAADVTDTELGSDRRERLENVDHAVDDLRADDPIAVCLDSGPARVERGTIRVGIGGGPRLDGIEVRHGAGTARTSLRCGRHACLTMWNGAEADGTAPR